MNDISVITAQNDGLCQCGCGDPAPIATKTRTSLGHKKGEPIPFINGHNQRKAIQYVEEDRGYRTPCWVWQLGKTIWGYGVIHIPNKGSRAAHREFYKRKYPNLSDTQHLDHLCRVRECVRPDHLEPVTPVVNIQRGRLATLTPYGVNQIRMMVWGTSLTRVEIAEILGVSPATVFAVLRGTIWKNYLPSVLASF